MNAAMPYTEQTPPSGVQTTAVRRWVNGHWQTEAVDWVAQETPVAVVVNGIAHTVMMATPSDLEDFALGFAVTEGLIDRREQLYGVDVHEQPQGIELQLEVAAEVEWRLRERRRSLAGRTGCGICGAESLGQVQRDLPAVPAVNFNAQAILRAHDQLSASQSLQGLTGATHAAAWFDTQGDIHLLREDVGRHNALDKLIGALLRSATPPRSGGVLITSRASFEMVQKTVALGASLLTAVSAPTALAITKAQGHNLCLVGFVRPGQCVAYSHPERLPES